MGRQKPGKPRRERPEPAPETHAHEGFEIPDDFQDPGGRAVDHAMLGSLLGAAMDGCTSCQDPLLTLLVEDPDTTARLVELSCVATHGMLGGLPSSMTDPTVPGPSSPEFRRLAAAGLDGANDAMWQACKDMSPTERRAAANTALDQLVGIMASGPMLEVRPWCDGRPAPAPPLTACSVDRGPALRPPGGGAAVRPGAE